MHYVYQCSIYECIAYRNMVSKYGIEIAAWNKIHVKYTAEDYFKLTRKATCNQYPCPIFI